MKLFTKESLIDKLLNLRASGWHKSIRPNNSGGIGNTIEFLLGIEENNLPSPNAGEWELKTQRKATTSLITLFHLEPSPQTLRWVPAVLLPKYGWPHKSAGEKYQAEEKSFRQTLNALKHSDRGFIVVVNQDQQRVEISFDANQVGERHQNWLQSVEQRIGLGQLEPLPYWGFQDLHHKAGSKLHNTFLVEAEAQKPKDRTDGVEEFRIGNIYKLQKFSLHSFLDCLENAMILVDFDARTGHNHGTKFRLRQNAYVKLFEEVEVY